MLLLDLQRKKYIRVPKTPDPAKNYPTEYVSISYVLCPLTGFVRHFFGTLIKDLFTHSPVGG